MAIISPRCGECGAYVRPHEFVRHRNACEVCVAALETLKVKPLPPPALPSPPRLPRINCAICRKPVDKVVVRDDDCEKMRYIRVSCHGATDEMRIDLMQLTSSQIKQMNEGEGLAFATKKIEGAANE